MKKIIAFVLVLSPLLAFAQTTITNIDDVSRKAVSIGNLMIGLAISIAILWIIINVVRYLIATNDPEKRKQGGQGILFGVVGLFVILSIWGLVAILRNSFRTSENRPDTSQLYLPDPTIRNGGGGGGSGPSDIGPIPGVNTGF